MRMPPPIAAAVEPCRIPPASRWSVLVSSSSRSMTHTVQDASIVHQRCQKLVLLQDLNAVVVGVAHYDAAVTVDGYAAKWGFELPIAATFAADGADVRAVGVIQHLHAMIAVLNHDHMTGAVKRNTVRFLEMAITCAKLADGPQVLPIAVTKNLDAIVAAVGNNKISLRVKRHAAVASQLLRPAAPAANAADVGAISETKNLNATIIIIIIIIIINLTVCVKEEGMWGGLTLAEGGRAGVLL